MKRQSISKKTRFEIFKRDGFTCQYCGATPPQAVLHIDHINPVSKGGDNAEHNLISACQSCNLGKGARLLNVAPQSLSKKAQEIEEREEQIRGYQAIVQGRKDRLDSEVWKIVKIFDGSETASNQNYQSILRFIEKLGYFEVEEAMELARMKHNYIPNRFKYFCGICWNKINREKEAV